MEYIFQLGSFPYLSLAEIITVLESESIEYKVVGQTLEELHLEIDNINPEVFLTILGGTRSITNITTGEVFEQNIKEYKKREFKKPRVDAKNGLLPSKLSKMMINLSFTKKGVHMIYDPFCGGGTIITEANVMGVKGIGSDIDQQMVKDAKANAKWMSAEYHLPSGMYEFFQSDITAVPVEHLRERHVDAIVTEPYLGIPVNKPLRMGKNDEINLRKVNGVISEALKKASAILNVGERIVIIIPCYRTVKGIKKLDVSESFNRFSFKKVNPLEGLNIDKSQNLLYFRPKAVVLREIFILEKI